MQNELDNSELLISRLLDGELSEDAELELNRTLIREPEMMRLRDDYQKVNALAVSALDSLRCGGAINLDAVFDAAVPARPALRIHARRGWVMIPGAIAAALLAMVIPNPDYRPATTPIVTDASSLFSTAPGSTWNGSELARPVSTMPRIRSQTGRDVIGAVGDDGNLYWIEVEKTRTVRWPAGAVAAPDGKDSM